MSSFRPPADHVIVGAEPRDRTDVDAAFEEARRFIDAHWTEFDDPSGVAADLTELKVAVAQTRPVNAIRTRLTLHRLNRIAGNAAPVAAVIAIVREVLGAAQ
jgi:hypothetical protein